MSLPEFSARAPQPTVNTGPRPDRLPHLLRRHPHPASEEGRETATSVTLDRPVRVGIGQWQNTAAQRSSYEIDEKVKEYADRLAKLHAAQVHLYHALLWTDETAAEFAAADVRAAINELPEMPDWPDTDEELIARLRGKSALARPVRPETSTHLATEHRAIDRARREG